MNTIKTTTGKLTYKTLTTIAENFGWEIDRDESTGLYFLGVDRNEKYTAKQVVDTFKMIYGEIVLSFGYNSFGHPCKKAI